MRRRGMKTKRFTLLAFMLAVLMLTAACTGLENYADGTKTETTKTADNTDETQTKDTKTTAATDQEKTASTTATEKAETTRDGYYGALKVNGAKLQDADGNDVVLYGVSTHGLGWYPQYVNKDLMTELRDTWGCNVFRLAMYTAEYNGYCTSDDKQKEKLKTLITDAISWANELDMYVIVDWHILSDGDPNTYKEEAKDFFKGMSERFGDDPHVIYEVCNEPNGKVTWPKVKSYAEEVIPVIRENAPNSIIIVGSPNWSQDVDKVQINPITGYENIMYTLHFYADTHKDYLRNRLKAAAKKDIPIFVTEFGICDSSGNGSINTAEADKWMEVLDEYGVSRCIWSLTNKNESASLIKFNVSKTKNIKYDDLAESGTWFIDMMKGHGLVKEEELK